MTNFEWYRSFIAVYRSGTVTGAAEARYLTQPAISQHIAALESAVGHALFTRAPRRMVPTDHGKTLYSRVAPAMDNLEQVSIRLRETSIAEEPLIRLGTPLDYFHEAGFEKLKDSQFRLQVEIGDTEKMIDRLFHGKLDAVIATQQIRGANIDYTKIGQENFYLVSAPHVSLPIDQKSGAGQRGQIEKSLLDMRWVSYSAELPIIRRFWHVAFQKRPDIEPRLIVPSLLLIRKAVESGLGVSVLPEYICRQSLESGSLKILWKPGEPVVNDLWIATRKVDRNKPEISLLIRMMR